MTPSAVALLGFVAWTIFLLVLLALLRTSLVSAGKKKSNAFDPSGQDLPGFPQRLTRAHANCYENLPVAAAILLYAIATNQTAVTDSLALAFLGARVLQSLTHLVSTSRPAVFVRFLLFVAQIVILVIWLLKLTHMI